MDHIMQLSLCHASLVGHRISMSDNCATGSGRANTRGISVRCTRLELRSFERMEGGFMRAASAVTSRETSARVSVVFSRNAIKAILAIALMPSSPFASIFAVRLDDTQDSSPINSTSCLQKTLVIYRTLPSMPSFYQRTSRAEC